VALAMLIPCAVPRRWQGWAIDMFGPVLTHIHNGDPLNDSTRSDCDVAASGSVQRAVGAGRSPDASRRRTAAACRRGRSDLPADRRRRRLF